LAGDDLIAILRVSDGAHVSTVKARALSRLNFGARWMPDGKSIVYIALDRGTANLWSHPIDGGEPTQLTDFSGGDIYNFAFSTDGRRIFLARGHPIHDAMLIRNFK
jgi:Tol biopolymer transport system component